MARLQQRRRRGFSLIELSVVLATISVLASIAIPRFQHSFKRARAVEAMQTIATLERFLKEHYNRTGEYPRVSGVQNPTGTGYDRKEMDPTLPGWKELGFKPESSYRFRYSFTTIPNASGRYTTAVIEAVADTDNDGRAAHYFRRFEEGTQILDPPGSDTED